MPSTPLKVKVPVIEESVEAAIATLTQCFLQATKTGYRIGQEPSEFNLAHLCKSLIEDWQSGKVAFARGDITLTFIAGTLSPSADVLVYNPVGGDRFLYTGGTVAPPRSMQSPGDLEPAIASQQSLQAMAAVLEELAAHQRTVEGRLRELQRHQAEVAGQPRATSDLEAIAREVQIQLESQFVTLTQTLTQTFTQILSNHVNSTALHFNERFDKMQTQLDHLARQLQELSELSEPDTPRGPQTEAEWLKLMQTTWGTVGDYEQYSFSYRAANADPPLFATPDWVALCELEWARKLHPTLTFLYDLIHGEGGIGYTGADILQQFGCHIDSQTGDRYYIYHQGGFTPYEALWQTAVHPQHSWLPELQRLTARTANRQHGVFELFGWEPEAIASLEKVVKRATYDQAHQSTQRSTNAISDYLALLNLGPFTPMTQETIKRAYRQAMKTAHPDAGGSKEQAQQIIEAYEAVLNHYFPMATS